MKFFSTVVLFVAALISSVVGDCWWTGCQPNSWAVVGCAQYNRVEKGREACAGGNKYYCCTNDGGGGGGGGGGGSGGGGDARVTFSQFQEAVTSNGYPAPSYAQYTSFSQGAGPQGKITTKQELAMALAQFIHESDGLRAKREYACVNNNCPNSYRTPGCDAPNQYYYGRGYIQLSWCGNYRDASNAIFGWNRLVNDPDFVARDEKTAWDTAFWYWGRYVHTKPGVTEGKFGASTDAINGALECRGGNRATAWVRYEKYKKVRRAFGLPGDGDPSGC